VTLEAALALGDTTASLISIVAMVLGWRAIKRKNVKRHRALMLTAAGAAAVFLVLFVYRFVRFGFGGGQDTGARAVAYLIVSIAHEPIAVINVPLVLCALVLGLTGRFAAHREVARIALPVWLYVAVTGVVLYLLRA
jgi:putative membrane protein